jgi:hypothetical protein
VEHQAQTRKARKEAERQRIREREELVEGLTIFAFVVVLIGSAIGAFYLFYVYKM